MTRKETIKWLESLKAEIGKSEHRTLWHYAEAIDMAIEALSADAVQGEWIPCSERLPEDKCDVLIQFGWNMAVGCIDGGDWRINSGDAWCTEVAEDDGKPIAWMPLPKPYRKDGEDNGED